MTPLLRLGDRVRLIPTVASAVIDGMTGEVSYRSDPTIWTVLRQDGDLVMVFERRSLGTWFELIPRDKLDVVFTYPHKVPDAAPEAG